MLEGADKNRLYRSRNLRIFQGANHFPTPYDKGTHCSLDIES